METKPLDIKCANCLAFAWQVDTLNQTLLYELMKRVEQENVNTVLVQALYLACQKLVEKVEPQEKAINLMEFYKHVAERKLKNET